MTRNRKPDLVDQLIGRNIRLQRVKQDLSQAELGSAVHITFQQVQKYERAKSRIPASRLFRIAQALKVPVATFFEELHLIDGTAVAPTAPPSAVPTERHRRH